MRLAALLLLAVGCRAAVLNFGGFETGDTGDAIGTTGTCASVQNSTVISGVYSFQCNPTGTAFGGIQLGIYSAAGATNATLNAASAWFGFRFRPVTLPASSSEIFARVLTNAGGNQFYLFVDSGGHIVSHDSANAVITTGSTVLSAGSTYLIELTVTQGNPGTYQVRINGNVEMGDSTHNMATTNVGSLVLGKAINTNGQTVNFIYDDWYISSSGYEGTNTGKVAIILPNGAGTTNAWTAGTAPSNYTDVLEVPTDGATTTIQSTAQNNVATFNMTDSATAGISGTIQAVKEITNCIQVTTASAFKNRFKSGATNSDSATFSGGSAYAWKGFVQLTDPATTMAWTTTGIDALELGMIDTSTTVRTNCSTVYGMVYYTPAAATGYVRRRVTL
jgi:hypothetical protein